jgi:hypothetical protein
MGIISYGQTNGIIAIDILKNINTKELHNRILKYIAPYFQLEQKSTTYN